MWVDVGPIRFRSWEENLLLTEMTEMTPVLARMRKEARRARIG